MAKLVCKAADGSLAAMLCASEEVDQVIALLEGAGLNVLTVNSL